MMKLIKGSTPTTLHRGAGQNLLPVETHPRPKEALRKKQNAAGQRLLFIASDLGWHQNSVLRLLLVISLALAPSAPQIFYMSVCPSIRTSVCLSTLLPICPSVFLFVYPFALPLSIYLSNNNGSTKILITTRPRFTIYPLPPLPLFRS